MAKTSNVEQGYVFYVETYSLISKLLKINPIREGLELKKEIKKLFLPDDIFTLDSDTKRSAVEHKANILCANYIRRTGKFFLFFQVYCYLMGKKVATDKIGKYVKDSPGEMETIDSFIDRLLKLGRK